MKYIQIGLIILSLTLLSCEQEFIDGVTDPEIQGSWNLSAVLTDPGNGSGTFQDVDSEAEVEFFTNGKFSANFDLCSFGVQTGTSSEGRYSVSDKTLSPNNCDNASGPVLSYQAGATELIIRFPCREPCVLKFERIYIR